MKNTAWKILSAIPLVCLAIGIAISIALGGCTTMIECTSGFVPMKCHWTFTATPYMLAIGAITSLGALTAKTKEGRRMAALGTLAACAAGVLVSSPAGIGICAKAGMTCHFTAYVVWAACVIAGIAAIVQLAKADPQAANAPKMKL